MIALGGGAARADQVDRLVDQLQSSKEYKVRLSAALNLAKLGDRRAIPVFIQALEDPDKTVRGVAAAGLGKLVNASTPGDVRSRVLAALRQTASADENAFVRNQAQKAYDALKRPAGEATAAMGATYVQLGAMAAEAGNRGELVALMRQTAQRTFKSRAPAMVTEWPGGAPSARSIRDRGLQAFFVDGTVNAINASAGAVECKVSMLLATYPQKSMFGFLKGGAKVEGGSSAGDTALAAQDCVVAVVEDLIARKIIPTIQARTQ
jgi:hypothetical protein